MSLVGLGGGEGGGGGGGYIYIYIYRRFRGVSPACPTPVTGRSTSFRLRFRFVRAVRAVRAGEAKLRGRM